MPEWVRVKDPVSRHEFTITRDHADSAGLKPIDKPAADTYGNPLPPKHHIDLNALSLADLQAQAESAGVDVTGLTKKADIAAALNEES